MLNQDVLKEFDCQILIELVADYSAALFILEIVKMKMNGIICK